MMTIGGIWEQPKTITFIMMVMVMTKDPNFDEDDGDDLGAGGGDEDDDERHLGGAKDGNFPHKVWAVLLSSGGNDWDALWKIKHCCGPFDGKATKHNFQTKCFGPTELI